MIPPSTPNWHLANHFSRPLTNALLKRTNSTPIGFRRLCHSNARRPCVRHMQGCYGQNSSIIIPSVWLDGDPNGVPTSAARERTKQRLAHLFNRDIISMPDEWNTHGTLLGIWHSTWFRWQGSTPTLPKSNCCCFCANGTCIPVGRFLLTNGTLVTSILSARMGCLAGL